MFFPHHRTPLQVQANRTVIKSPHTRPLIHSYTHSQQKSNPKPTLRSLLPPQHLPNLHQCLPHQIQPLPRLFPLLNSALRTQPNPPYLILRTGFHYYFVACGLEEASESGVLLEFEEGAFADYAFCYFITNLSGPIPRRKAGEGITSLPNPNILLETPHLPPQPLHLHTLLMPTALNRKHLLRNLSISK